MSRYQFVRNVKTSRNVQKNKNVSNAFKISARTASSFAVVVKIQYAKIASKNLV
jgi:hypothetical protein